MRDFIETLVMYLQKGSLSGRIVLPERVQALITTGLVIFSVIMALVYGVYLITKREVLYCNRGEYTIHRILLLFLSLWVSFVYLVCPDAIMKTFVPHLPRFWKQIGWALLLVLMIGQCKMLFNLLDLNDDYTDRGSSYRWLISGMGFYLIALAVSLVFRRLHEYAYWIGLGVMALQILLDALFTLKNKSSFFSFLWNTIWFIICMVGLMIWADMSIAIFLIAMVIIFFIMGVFAPSGPSRCCGNCRTYSNGYCHYRGDSVSSSDYCSKWEPRS